MVTNKESRKRFVILACLLILPMLSTPAAFSNSCRTDINEDDQVDFDDMEILRFEFGRNDCYTNPCLTDLNDDGNVDNEDVKLLGAEFGRDDCRFIEPATTRFNNNGNGTVTDTETGLMWTKSADLFGDTLLYHQALDYIAGMNGGQYTNFGYSDWRLPSLSELRSLIDYTKLTNHGHKLPWGHPFKNIQSLNFNSKSSYLFTADFSWFVSLYCRAIGHNVPSCYGYVWPVRGRQ